MSVIEAVLAFLKAVGTVLGLIQQSQERTDGARIEAGAVSAVSATQEAAIAAAAVSAPDSVPEVVDVLKEGKF